MTDTWLAPAQRHAPLVRIFHWIVALLVLVVFPVGALIKFVAKDFQGGFYLVHESFGFLILWVMLARLLIRLRHPAPPEPWLSPFERRASEIVHRALYACLILQPVLGFLMTNAYGFPLSWFGVVTVPSPLGAEPAVAPYLKGGHIVIGWLILLLFLAHMAGVVRHHLIKRDATLYRIL
jgi:cytochrome b561